MSIARRFAALARDVDDALAQTKRDGYGVACNLAFESLGLPWRCACTGGHGLPRVHAACAGGVPVVVTRSVDCPESVMDGVLAVEPGSHQRFGRSSP